MEIENLDEMEVIEVAEDQPENEELETEDTDDGEYEVVSIDGETPPEQEEEPQVAPKWVKELRKSYRSAQEENRKLREELNRASTVAPSSAKPPRKPTLEDDGIDYDAELYEQALDQWYRANAEHQRKEQEAAKMMESQQKQVATVMENYAKAKNNLRVPDFDLAEDVVVAKLPIELQNVILATADNPATVVYALGKNSSKLDELAKISDPLKFAKELGKLETKLKVERKGTPPSPEKRVVGSAHASGVDSALDSLRKEAERTGDYSKVFAYKQQKKGN